MFSQEELESSDSQNDLPTTFSPTNPFGSISSNPFVNYSLNPFASDPQLSDESISQQNELATNSSAAVSCTNKKRKLDIEENSEANLKEIVERMEKIFIDKIEKLEFENRQLHDALNKKIDVIARNTARQNACIDELIAATRPRAGLYVREEDMFSPINSREDMDKLEENLKEIKYKEKLMHWLQPQVTRVDAENRLHDTIDLIFTRNFFATMNWTGISKTPGVHKIGLGNFKNIVSVFVDIGSNNNLVLDRKFVAQFLMKKLSHAKDRIKISDNKQTSCHVMKRQ
ncbi:uncharacterized protein LOC131293907 [Anopheles ziemanni]|uniref:uncharacterized protein LOC131264670 n=1 Tax=Anopheles coustani TaxID=139045 RepID=UPI00265A93AC|nr:uncharacterized protein LOC131264670 [Anopheles coustani]XP_058177940.1 uncharacterized protein LOC131293907 [Anopheles ziemanni]